MAHAIDTIEENKLLDWHPAYYLIQGGFYFGQGVFNAGLALYIQVSMANWAVSASTQATVIAIIAIPLYLKMFIGLLTDRVPIGRWGRRRPYIVMGMLLYFPAFALLAASQSFGSGWVFAILLTMGAWMLVDTTADALSVEVTPHTLTARMQSASNGCIWAGIVLGSLLAPRLGAAIGWIPAIGLLTLVVLAGSGVTLLYPATRASQEVLANPPPLHQMLRNTLFSPGMGLAVLFFILFSASRGYDSLINVYLLTELGWADRPALVQAVGQITALGFLGNLAGAALAWRVPTRWLRSTRLYAGVMAGFWLCTLPWILVNGNPDNLFLIYATRILVGVASGLLAILGNSLIMRLSRRNSEGLTFATLAAASNVGQVTLGPKTVAAVAGGLGGLLPAFFTLIPFGLLSLGLLNRMMNTSPDRDDRAGHLPVALTEGKFSQPAPPAGSRPW